MKPPTQLVALFASVIVIASSYGSDGSTNRIPSHPRLYFDTQELMRLRALRAEPAHARIWTNLVESAEWCLTKSPRTNWIAPVSPDPIYENLYDRFYAIMGDLAITEHLSFAYALTGNRRYGEAARRWALASCRAWQHEAEGEPDSGKGYAVSRLLKGIAVAYDVAFDCFSDAERKEIRGTLERIGRTYYQKYFSTPAIAGPGFHTHHAIVEWSSFGVVALTLLGEAPDAQKWVDATVNKFESHLLPTGLASDGAQVEGATFWASTMQYRMFFMDPLRRVTGRDLFKKFVHEMNADLALASIASEHFPGYAHNNDDTVLEPYYGQLDYYSPVLVCMAREYRRPLYQHLANWDHTLGAIQKTRAITPHGEQLLFELGGYAYCWCDATVPDDCDNAPLSYFFKSIGEAYLRSSWRHGDLLLGVRKDGCVVHADGKPVVVLMNVDGEPVVDCPVDSIADNGTNAKIRCGATTNLMVIEFYRRDRALQLTKHGTNDLVWYCPQAPEQTNGILRWGKNVELQIQIGKLVRIDRDVYEPLFATGFNKLKMKDPAPIKYTRVVMRPDGGVVGFKVRHRWVTPSP
ncbi:MAG: DUF4962 domain-containing protein [Limisphaerales bacterium]